MKRSISRCFYSLSIQFSLLVFLSYVTYIIWTVFNLVKRDPAGTQIGVWQMQYFIMTFSEA